MELFFIMSFNVPPLKKNYSLSFTVFPMRMFSKGIFLQWLPRELTPWSLAHYDHIYYLLFLLSWNLEKHVTGLFIENWHTIDYFSSNYVRTTTSINYWKNYGNKKLWYYTLSLWTFIYDFSIDLLYLFIWCLI